MINKVAAYTKYKSKQYANNIFLHLIGSIEELNSDGSANPLPYAPLFIIGPPRTGSTLLYQAITYSMDVGYLSNNHMKYYTAPALYEKISRHEKLDVETFESSYGRTKSGCGPHEGGSYFNRFFPTDPQYVKIGDVSEKKIKKFRGSLRKLTEAFKKPIVFKNMPCALRLQILKKYIPEAVYIIIHRDIANTAASILQARKSITGSINNWWSLKIPDYDKLSSLTPEEQVIKQIRSIQDIIYEDIKNINQNNIINIDYSSLCKDPNQIISNLINHVNNIGIHIKIKNKLPTDYEYSQGEKYWLERVKQYL